MRVMPNGKAALAATGLLITLVAFAAGVQIVVRQPFKISDGNLGDKPKIQRMGDGTLVSVYGDAPPGAGTVYDVKAAVERPARDVFVKTCKPGPTRTCDNLTDWSAATNVSNSALQSSGSFDWQGTGAATAYPGDIDKANVKASGPLIVITWVSKYCPDGDLSAPNMQAPVQRGVRYNALTPHRVIPFSCVWLAYSANSGTTWSPPRQLSTGERDAIQDASGGNIGATKKGQINVSWQEDPRGLLLGGADGSGDGASGALVSGGTDIWYTYATVDLTATKPTPGNEYSTAYLDLQPAMRLTDNFTGPTASSTVINDLVITNTGATVPNSQIDGGTVGASRANIGMVDNVSIVAYEESKGGSSVADPGKLVRYHAFQFDKPGYDSTDVTSNDPRGCVISNPAHNARRVRFLSQSAADAGTGGIQLAIFWKEGLANGGGPSDIVLRRGIDGVQPGQFVPAVDTAHCITSVPDELTLIANANADNVSSQTPTATAANLADDTEVNNQEGAQAHRGLLRGRDMWIGYSYVGNLSQLSTQQDNYNFWIRHYNVDTKIWDNPKNITNIANKAINVREPRIFGTPKSGATCSTDATQCQNIDVIYLAWGTQTNDSAASDLGEYITVSTDSAAHFSPVASLSTVHGVLAGDTESAYESQLVSRPDGNRFYGVWSQTASTSTEVEYTSGDLTVTDSTATTASTDTTSVVSTDSGSSGGCTLNPRAEWDPGLPALIMAAAAGLVRHRRRRSVSHNRTGQF
jgi:hypothetical protein